MFDRLAVPKDEVLAIFATVPAIDVDALCSDLDASLGQDQVLSKAQSVAVSAAVSSAIWSLGK